MASTGRDERVSDGSHRRAARLARPADRLPERVWLTYKHRGPRQLAYRAATFPLRFTPLEPLLRLNPSTPDRTAYARRWYRRHGRPVTIVIPSYRDAELVAQLVRRIRRTTAPERVRIVVADDAAGPEHLAALGRIDGIRIVPAARQRGLRGQRQPRAAGGRPAPRRRRCSTPTRSHAAAGWPRCSTPRRSGPGSGSSAPSCCTPTTGSSTRARSATSAHRSGSTTATASSRPTGGRPASRVRRSRRPAPACTSRAPRCRRSASSTSATRWRSRTSTTACARGRPGYEVAYAPTAQLVHLESVTRGTEQGERELSSQRAFWSRWSAFLDQRDVRTADGRLRVVYVTEGTGVGGGHRVVFEHLNGLAAKGHDVALWTLGERPRWFDAATAPCGRSPTYDDLDPGAGARRRDQGRDLVGDVGAGVARERRARDPRLLRAGHRDELLLRPARRCATACWPPTVTSSTT